MPTNSLPPKITYEKLSPINTPVAIHSDTPYVNLVTPKYSEEPSTSQISHSKRDVTLATSSIWRAPGLPVLTEKNTIGYFPQPSMPMNYGKSLYSFNSNHDYRRSPQSSENPVPAALPLLFSSYKPSLETSVLPAILPKSPVQVEKHKKSDLSLLASPPHHLQLSSTPATHVAATSGPLPKPLSLSSQLGFSQNQSMRSKTLTIGYSPQQRQQIEEAQSILAETMRRQEAETKTKLEAQKEAEEAMDKLEAEKKAKKEADEILAKGEKARQLILAEDDDDVNHFRQCLDTRIKESRDSKNLKGALAGRQNTLNVSFELENVTLVILFSVSACKNCGKSHKCVQE